MVDRSAVVHLAWIDDNDNAYHVACEIVQGVSPRRLRTVGYACTGWPTCLSCVVAMLRRQETVRNYRTWRLYA